MTNPNPFAPNVPAQQAPPAQGGNPFAAPAQQPAAAPAPASNPYAQPGAAPQQQYGPATNGYYAQQAPAQPAYAPAPQAAPPAIDPNALSSVGAPPPAADGKGAKFADMYGRLVVIFPHSFEQKPKNPRFITPEDRANGNLMQDQITATVVVIDDGQGGYGPISWGGSAMPPVPHTNTDPLPYVRRGMWISQGRVVAQLRPYLPQTPGAAPGVAVGRILKAGNEHNSPWYLAQATEADLAHARTYLNLVQQGQVPHPLAMA